MAPQLYTPCVSLNATYAVQVVRVPLNGWTGSRTHEGASGALGYPRGDTRGRCPKERIRSDADAQRIRVHSVALYGYTVWYPTGYNVVLCGAVHETTLASNARRQQAVRCALNPTYRVALATVLLDQLPVSPLQLGTCVRDARVRCQGISRYSEYSQWTEVAQRCNCRWAARRRAARAAMAHTHAHAHTSACTHTPFGGPA